MTEGQGPRLRLRLYLSRPASSLRRYVWEQLVLSLFGWVPTVVGIGLRGVVYRLILTMEGTLAIERGVRRSARSSATTEPRSERQD